MSTRRIVPILYAATLVAGVVSATCFVTQGGFGAGHGDWDLLLWLLSLPWSLISWPHAIENSDFIRLTLLPFVLNLLAITLLREGLRRLMPARAKPSA